MEETYEQWPAAFASSSVLDFTARTAQEWKLVASARGKSNGVDDDDDDDAADDNDNEDEEDEDEEEEEEEEEGVEEKEEIEVLLLVLLRAGVYGEDRPGVY